MKTANSVTFPLQDRFVPSTSVAYRRLAVCVALPCLLVVNGIAGVLSGPIVNPANSHTYYLLGPNSWTASQAEAVSLGGNLVTINDQAENDWVYNTFQPLLPPINGDVGSTLWIGLNDVASEGNFVWASGEPVLFTNWQVPAQPDNAGGFEHFAHMWGPTSTPSQPSVWGQWNDYPDSFDLAPGYGVLEVVPEPSSYGLMAALGLLALGGYRRWTAGKAAGAR